MLTAKSFVVLAAAAFAVAQVEAAAESSVLKISIHHNHKQAAPCQAGFREVSVEGVAGVFCAKDQICVADKSDGNCPTESAPGMPYGAYCDKVKTGVYGCKPVTEDMLEDGCDEGETEMSVEGVEGIFCIKGPSCVADNKDGVCPGPSEGLPYGASCGIVKTGVYGCKPNSKPTLRAKSHNKTHHKQKAPCQPGFREVSVEGVPGIYCAKDQICVANIYGSCPGPSDGLQYGAYCGTVKSGVLGCKPKTKWMARKSVQKKAHVKAGKCGAGMTEVSVEGVAGVFCAKDQICVADKADGNCPTESAPGMPYGAYCDIVKTGVYGCKPVTEDMLEDSEESEDSEECGEGESPMSVEGVEDIFCVKGQACVADIKDGACPGAQEGLPFGSYCGKVKTGVYGCIPNHHKKH